MRDDYDITNYNYNFNLQFTIYNLQVTIYNYNYNYKLQLQKSTEFKSLAMNIFKVVHKSNPVS